MASNLVALGAEFAYTWLGLPTMPDSWVLPGLQVDKAPLESYADVGGLESQIQEIKEAVELPLTHPELYEDIGIKPPKVGWPTLQSCVLLSFIPCPRFFVCCKT